MENKSSHSIIKTILIIIIIILLIATIAVISIGIINPSALYSVPVIGSLMQSINPVEPIEEDEPEEVEEEPEEINEEEPEDEEPPEDEKDDDDDKDNNVINVALNEEDKNMIPYDNEIEELLLNYSVGINRIDNNLDNYENNAALLLIANNYFESQNTATLEIDTKYAATKEHIHKYLSELTTIDFSKVDHLDSYSNIIRYVKKNDTYLVGSDVSLLKREKFSLADLEYTDNGDGTYSGTAVVLRSIKQEDGTRENTNYEIRFKFRLNERFTYSKYKILSFSAANKDYYPDNTYHLQRN